MTEPTDRFNKIGGYFILGGKDEHEAIPIDYDSWLQWFAEAGVRVVAQEQCGDWFVSTVFLGIDVAFGLGHSDKPRLFETMIFHNGESCDCWRWSTWEEAVAQHARAVAFVSANA